MKKKIKIIIPLILVLVLTLLVFHSCYHIDSSDVSDYKDFMSKMSDRNEIMYKFFPKLENTDCIDEIYLYFSDNYLFDSMYTAYVNCVYDDETYASEIKRLESRYGKFSNYSYEDSYEYDVTEEEESFTVYASHNGGETTSIRYLYALRNEEENRIVYVGIFQKCEIDIIKDNIPNEYLPKKIQDTKKITSNDSQSSLTESSELTSVESESSAVEDESSAVEDESSTVEEVISVKRADKEFQIDGAVKFVDEKALNTDWHLNIEIAEPVSKFHFFSVNGDYLPGDYNTPVDAEIIDEILFSYGRLTANTPILIDTYINDAVANRGVSYVDEKGETKYFVMQFNASGIGPQVYLVRFYVAE